MKIQALSAARFSLAILLALFLSASFACHKKRTEKTASAPASNVAATAGADSSATTAAPEAAVHLVASFERTSCFGSCPSFKAEFYSDGAARYEGRRFAPRSGKFAARCSQAWLAELQKQATEAGFFGFALAYPTDGRKIVDLPMAITYVRADGRERRVQNNYDAPLALLALEKFFEQKIEQLEWRAEN